MTKKKRDIEAEILEKLVKARVDLLYRVYRRLSGLSTLFELCSRSGLNALLQEDPEAKPLKIQPPITESDLEEVICGSKLTEFEESSSLFDAHGAERTLNSQVRNCKRLMFFYYKVKDIDKLIRMDDHLYETLANGFQATGFLLDKMNRSSRGIHAASAKTRKMEEKMKQIEEIFADWNGEDKEQKKKLIGKAAAETGLYDRRVKDLLKMVLQSKKE